ncbi:hypothetical protein Cgig2_025068 [Carnegiea gigantea]|uniref:Uncharacterized protein n=1 Tax=Carnegiea gigantea TaxID=171969 RepID=A0A9Q1Q4C8_9CARY|nr:hypothetical protein Cgig2_025068 [Carnegiea gigantea]
MGFAHWCSISISFGSHLAKSLSIMVFPYFFSTEEMTLNVLGTFNWRLRRATRPPRLLSEDYHDLYLYFILADAEEAAHDFHIPELVQAIFYAIVVNKALELGVLRRSLVEDLKSALIGLRNNILIAHRPGPVAPGVGPMPANSQEESTGSNDTTSPSSDMTTNNGTQAGKDENYYAPEDRSRAHG